MPPRWISARAAAAHRRRAVPRRAPRDAAGGRDDPLRRHPARRAAPLPGEGVRLRGRRRPPGPRPASARALAGRPQVAFAALNALWLADVSGGRARAGSSGRTATRYLLAPSWTPDGRGLVYADDRDGLLAVRRRDLGSGEETVLAAGGRVFPALSPDGTRLACLDMAGNLVVRDLGGRDANASSPRRSARRPARPAQLVARRPLPRAVRPQPPQPALPRGLQPHPRRRHRHAATAALHAVAPHASLSDRYDSRPRLVARTAAGWPWSSSPRCGCCRSRPTAPRTASRAGSPTRAADHPSWSARLPHPAVPVRAAGCGSIDVATAARPVPCRVPLDYRRPRPADTVVHAGRLWDGTGEHGPRGRRHRGARRADHRGRTAPRGPPAARRVDASRPHRRARAVGRAHPPLAEHLRRPADRAPARVRHHHRRLARRLRLRTGPDPRGGRGRRARRAAAAGHRRTARRARGSPTAWAARTAPGRGCAARWSGPPRSTGTSSRPTSGRPAGSWRRRPGFAHERLGVRAGSHLCTPGVQLGQDLTTHLQATQRLEFGHATIGHGARLPGRRGDLHGRGATSTSSPRRSPPRRCSAPTRRSPTTPG